MRVKGGKIRNQRRKRILKEAKGFWGAKSKLYKKAKEQVVKAQARAFNDRRKRKGDFRKLWITRINAAVRPYNMSYSKFMNGLKQLNININRKMLSEMAIHNPEEFEKLVNQVKNISTTSTPKIEN